MIFIKVYRYFYYNFVIFEKKIWIIQNLILCLYRNQTEHGIVFKIS